MLLSEGQMSDYKGAALIINALPPAKQLLGDKGYDANWFRQALAARGITACIPSKSNRAKPIEHDRMLYRQCHKIENTFGKLKDWRRVQICTYLHVCHLHRSSRDLLALINELA
jgi:transposase